MPGVRHVAMCVANIDREAAFYTTLFGLVETERGSTVRADYCYFIDGERHLALLHYRSDAMAGIANSGSFLGAHHFGIQVENLQDAQARCEAAGARFHFNLGDEQEGNFESKYRDPNGAIFDLSFGGWTGTPTQRVGKRLHRLADRSDAGAATLCQVTVTVADPARSAVFFCKAFGFREERPTPVASAARVDVSDGCFRIAFVRCAEKHAVIGVERGADYAGTHHLGFRVPDLRTFESCLVQAGGSIVSGLDSGRHPSFGEYYYADPEGIVFTVCS